MVIASTSCKLLCCPRYLLYDIRVLPYEWLDFRFIEFCQYTTTTKAQPYNIDTGTKEKQLKIGSVYKGVKIPFDC